MLIDYNMLEDTLERKLEILRKLDSIIDFSRSSYQLNIIVLLGKTDKPLDPGKISSTLQIPRKQVLDALRKLKIKGLVESSASGYYMLTNNGREFYTTLIELLDVKDPGKGNGNGANMVKARNGNGSKVVSDISFHSRIATLIYVISLLNKPLSLEKASEILDVPKDEVLLHLTPYIKNVGDMGIFKIVKCSRGIFRRKIEKCIDMATGKKAIAKQEKIDSHYRLRKIIMRLTHTINPEIADILILTYGFAILSIALLIYRFTSLEYFVIIGGLASVGMLILFLLFHFTKRYNRRNTVSKI